MDGVSRYDLKDLSFLNDPRWARRPPEERFNGGKGPKGVEAELVRAAVTGMQGLEETEEMLRREGIIRSTHGEIQDTREKNPPGVLYESGEPPTAGDIVEKGATLAEIVKVVGDAVTLLIPTIGEVSVRASSLRAYRLLGRKR
jgi:hypothetical protein